MFLILIKRSTYWHLGHLQGCMKVWNLEMKREDSQLKSESGSQVYTIVIVLYMIVGTKSNLRLQKCFFLVKLSKK